MHSISKGKVSFKTLYIDHFSPVDRMYASKKYILLIVDAFIKFVKLYAIKKITFLVRRFDVSKIILTLIIDQRLRYRTRLSRKSSKL